MDRNYDFETILLISSKLQLWLLKHALKTQKSEKKVEIMYQNAIYIRIS